MAQTAPNTYPIGGILSEDVVSAYDFFKTERIPVLFARYGNQFMPMFKWLEGMGRQEPATSDEIEQWEENRYTRTLTVYTATPAAGGSAGDDPGAGNDTLIVPAAADLDVNYRFYPRKGDICMIPSGGTGNTGEVQAIIYSIDVSVPSAPVFRLKPVNASANIGSLTAGDELIITNAAFGAGTGQPEGTAMGSTKRTFVAQIIKETIGIEGSQLVNEYWYDRMDDGRDVRMWYTPGFLRADYYMGMKADGAFTFGQEATNATMVVPAGEEGAGNKIKTTKGAVPWIRELGYVMPINLTTFDIPDLDTVGLYLRSQGITSGTNMFLVGAQLNNRVENKAYDYLQNTGVDFTSVVDTYFGGSKELALSIGFRTLHKSGFTYMMKVMDLWSNPTLYGATGHNIDKYGIIMPLATFRDPKNPSSTIKNIGTRYRAQGKYNRRFEVWSVGGAGTGTKVTQYDKVHTYWRSHMAFTMIGVNQFVMLDPS